MRLSLFIAGRYLFAKKSHNVINIISAISAAGMAIGTAALIIILSVYNGFDSLIKSMMSNVEPDLMITPSRGKVFIPEGDTYDWIYDCDKVAVMCTSVQENVFINYEGKQSVATAKGVDKIYEEETPLRGSIRSGVFSLHKGDIPQTVVGVGLAYKTGINPAFLSPVEVYFPDRTAKISLANPISSINSIDVWPSGLFSVNNEIDNSLMVLPIEEMRELLGYEKEVSAVEITLVPGCSKKELKEIQKEIQSRLGDSFKVKDRYQQNESLYRMMKYEKAFIFLILLFVVIIIGFNIFGSLSMLIIEKKQDIATLKGLGADEKLIRRIFIFEGWMISLLGLVIGLAFGLLLAFLQQEFGFIKMPGNFVISPYPVIIKWQDILLTAASVAGIGYLVALLPVLKRK